jgi:RNA polymerase sigma factor (sigma-70 family)
MHLPTEPSPPRASEWLAAWQCEALARALGRPGSGEAAALSDAGIELERQILTGEVDAADDQRFITHCESVLRRFCAREELARICAEGARSRWPSADPHRNADAWQETYLRVARAILANKVDLSRPLGPYASTTAYHVLSTERRKEGRLRELDDTQLHRYLLGEGRDAAEQAEASIDGAELCASLDRLRGTGELSTRGERIVWLRYAEGWTGAEVAAKFELTESNVRQICRRVLDLLRENVDGDALGQAA